MHHAAEILVVNAAPEQAEQLRTMLAGRAGGVTIAPDLTAARLQLASLRPALVLAAADRDSDQAFDMCRQLKAHPGTATIPVILLVALLTPEDLLKVMACQADSFITWPCSAEALGTRLAPLLAMGQAQPPAALAPVPPAHADQGQVQRLLLAAGEEVVRQRLACERAARDLTDMLGAVTHLSKMVLTGQVTWVRGRNPAVARDILVVEDSPTQAAALAYQLEAAGHVVTLVGNGQLALAAIKARAPELILSDVVMPVMDGLELCRAIKEDRTLSHIPVVLLTTLASPDEIVEGIKAGADYYLTKPCDSDYLLSKVDALCSQPARSRQQDSDEQVNITTGANHAPVVTTHQQLVNLLLATFENTVRQNRELVRAQRDMQTFNEQLEHQINERTAALHAEVMEHKQVAARLLTSEERLRLLFISSRDALVTLSPPHWTVTSANPAAVAMFRAADEAALATGTFAQLSPLHQPDGAPAATQMEALMTTALAAGSHVCEWQHQRCDGTAFPASVQLTRCVLKDQVFLLATVRDLTAEKQAVAERERLAQAINQAAEAIVITDTKGVMQYVNPAFVAVSGYTQAEAVGQPARLLKSGQQDAAVYRTLWATVRSGKSWRGNLTNRRKDGTLYTAAAVISPIFDAGGQIVSFVAAQRDITRELELESQFRQSQKMDAIGRLAGGVAHDFNNLLAVIMGYAELLLADIPTDSPLYESATEIEAAGTRAAVLTRQLLTFSRKQQWLPTILCLNPVIENFEKMMRRLIGEDITLTIRTAGNLWLTKADPGGLEQVLMNLVVNARDAMPKGGQLVVETQNVTLDAAYVRHHVDAKPGDYVLLAVTDTGTGMSDEVLHHLFEPFFTTKEQGKGTGLGLSTVYGIVRQAGGHVSVESALGRGSTFRVYLPCATDVALDQSRTTAPVAPQGGCETVLLLEDEVQVRELTSELLTRAGYRVLSVANRDEAIQRLTDNHTPVHLLLTDVVMPHFSGPEVASALTAMQPGLKVLYMSGYAHEVMSQRGLLPSGCPLLAKPFRRDALLRSVRNTLDAL